MKTYLVLLVLAAAAAPAHADRRSFTRALEYATQPHSETELELYTTQTKATWENPSPKDFELQLAIEHGLSERWDFSIFHVFAQSTEEDFHFDQIALRSRYRFADRGDWPVDVVAVGQIGKVFGAGVWDGEARAVLARDLDDLRIAINLIGEVGVGPSVPEPVIEVGWAGGLTYQVLSEWQVGVESWGGLDVEATDEVAASVGPAVSWAPASTLWIAATAGFGVTDFAADFSVGAIIGVHL